MAPGERTEVVRLWHETSRDTYTFLPTEQGVSLEESSARSASA